MSLITNILILFAFSLALTNATDMIVGVTNGQLVYQENVKLGSIPLKTRTKNVFYTMNDTRTIKGISAFDIDKSKAKVSITAGGVGSSFVNVRLKSQSGDALNYLVQIFV